MNEIDQNMAGHIVTLMNNDVALLSLLELHRFALNNTGNKKSFYSQDFFLIYF